MQTSKKSVRKMAKGHNKPQIMREFTADSTVLWTDWTHRKTQKTIEIIPIQIVNAEEDIE